MDNLLDITAWREAFAQASSELGVAIAGWLPRVAAAAAIIVVGWALARVAAFGVRRGLRAVGADRAQARLAARDVLQHPGLRFVPSDVLSRLLYWLVLVSFVVLSLETLGVAALNATIDPVVAYLPQMTGVALIVLLGVLLARFLGAAASSASAAAGLPNASRVGFLLQVLIGGLVLVIAAEQLGVATEVLIAPMTALLASAGFAVGLAFALGARPIITHILAGHFLRQSLPRDAFVEINGDRGVVDRVGPTDTLLRGDHKTWSVPNARLLDEIVVR